MTSMPSLVPPTNFVWTDQEFLQIFSITRDVLLDWISQGLLVLTCPDGSLRITETAVNDFIRGRDLGRPLTIDEAARYLKRTRLAIYSLVKRGQLHPLPGSPGRLRFTRDALDRYLSTRRRG